MIKLKKKRGKELGKNKTKLVLVENGDGILESLWHYSVYFLTITLRKQLLLQSNFVSLTSGSG